MRSLNMALVDTRIIRLATSASVIMSTTLEIEKCWAQISLVALVSTGVPGSMTTIEKSASNRSTLLKKQLPNEKHG